MLKSSCSISVQVDGSRYLGMLGYCLIMLIGAPVATLTLSKGPQEK